MIIREGLNHDTTKTLGDVDERQQRSTRWIKRYSDGGVNRNKYLLYPLYDAGQERIQEVLLFYHYVLGQRGSYLYYLFP
jgi:hypothetical protein